MHLDASETVITWIPKNACSNLRHSAAVANAVVDSEDEYGAIEHMPYPFIPSYPQLLYARHTCVLLRCPYRRLISGYLDKVLTDEGVANAVSTHYCNGQPPGEISFHDFVMGLAKKQAAYPNIHWVPQSRFLAYKAYDHYYALENMSYAVEHLQSWIGFDFIDVSAQKRHDLQRHRREENADNHLRPASELKTQIQQQRAPSYESMLSPEIIAVIDKIYQQDLELYRRVCDTSNLLV